MIPPLAPFLGAIAKIIQEDADIQRIFGTNTFNHIPQDAPLPCLRFRLEQSGEWDTKDSDGHELFLTIDIWTNYRGDLEALQAADIVNNLFHNRVIPTGENQGQNLLTRHEFLDTFTEPDGVTHHSVLRFRLILTT